MKPGPGDTFRNAVSGLAFVGTLAALLAINPVKRSAERVSPRDQVRPTIMTRATGRRAFALGYYVTACPSADHRVRSALVDTMVSLAGSLSVPDSVLSRLRANVPKACFEGDPAALVGNGLDRVAEGFFILGQLAELYSEARRDGATEGKRRIGNEMNNVMNTLSQIDPSVRGGTTAIIQFRADLVDVDQLYRVLFHATDDLTRVLAPTDDKKQSP